MTTDHSSAARRIAAALRQAGYQPGRLTDNARTVLNRRYLKKDDHGVPTENPEDMFRRVAHDLSLAEPDPESRQRHEARFYELMTTGAFLPNSPTLMNAGRDLQQLSACFVLPVADSLDSIFRTVMQTALIHKSGGGTGFDFSKIRPEGDRVGTTQGVASGPVSFIEPFDNATEVIKQGGTRRGANMGILRCDHPEIEKFITRKNSGQHLQNFNISVAATDAFMAAAAANADYDLIHPVSGAATGRRNAKETLELITQCAWETGDPGLVFIDRINAAHPNAHMGPITATNPCGEQPLQDYESCNLGSVNLAALLAYNAESETYEMDYEAMASVIDDAVRLLDYVIDRNSWPVPEIAEASRRSRRIGLGVMGWADALIMMGLPYDSPAAVAKAQEVMGEFNRLTNAASSRLADERGCYPGWPGSRYERDNIPMRNTAPTTIAPTGTISVIAGASSGIEPLFALAYTRNVLDGQQLPEYNPLLDIAARHYCFDTPETRQALLDTGALPDDAPEWARELFRVSHQIAPADHIRMQAAFQAHTDNAVSKTINLPHDATVDDVRQAYVQAYESGCKGITVYRDGSKSSQVLSIGEQAPATDARPAPPTMRPRPVKLAGDTYRLRTGHGNLYVTINVDDAGEPFEIFTQVGKAGGCDGAQLEAISRLISMALRQGTPPEVIIEQLHSITCCPAWDNGQLVRSIPDGIAKALSQATGTEAPPAPADSKQLIRPGAGAPACPECGGLTHFAEGCQVCPACSWSKCE